MRFRKCLSILMVVCLFLYSAGDASGTRAGADTFVPGDTVFKLQLLAPIGTATNQKDDMFSCRVIEPGRFFNAIVEGKITRLKRSGKATGKSELALGFKSISFSDGRKGRFEAQIKEIYEVVGAGNGGRADDEGVVTAKSMRKRDTLKIALGATIGAVVGVILGGKTGAAAGAALGGALTAAGTLSERGPDLELKEGTVFSVLTGSRATRIE